MKEDYLKIICCPYCHGELKLEAMERKNDEIWTGKLVCKNCKKEYEIKEGIPVLM